ncbi:MAG TPA: acyl carrier protein [Candidatus Binatia bacterium]|nr:acyl carrier protein [Candidatus Binatia bacterium]
MSLQPGKFSPDTEELQRVLLDIFREFFDDEDLILRPEMTARDIDGWDSLANVRLLLTIERKYQIKFSASEIGGLENVGDLLQLIARKRGI